MVWNGINFYLPEISDVDKTVINEMKQTAALALGILVLKTVFVQLNEIIAVLFVLKCLKQGEYRCLTGLCF